MTFTSTIRKENMSTFLSEAFGALNLHYFVLRCPCVAVPPDFDHEPCTTYETDKKTQLKYIVCNHFCLHLTSLKRRKKFVKSCCSMCPPSTVFAIRRSPKENMNFLIGTGSLLAKPASSRQAFPAHYIQRKYVWFTLSSLHEVLAVKIHPPPPCHGRTLKYCSGSSYTVHAVVVLGRH